MTFFFFKRPLSLQGLWQVGGFAPLLPPGQRPGMGKWSGRQLSALKQGEAPPLQRPRWEPPRRSLPALPISLLPGLKRCFCRRGGGWRGNAEFSWKPRQEEARDTEKRQLLEQGPGPAS